MLAGFTDPAVSGRVNFGQRGVESARAAVLVAVACSARYALDPFLGVCQWFTGAALWPLRQAIALACKPLKSRRHWLDSQARVRMAITGTPSFDLPTRSEARA